VIGDILQPTHLLFVLVIALLVLGPKRLPEVGRSLGRGIRDFRGALSGDDHDEPEIPEHSQYTPPAPHAAAPATDSTFAQPAPDAAPAPTAPSAGNGVSESHPSDELVHPAAIEHPPTEPRSAAEAMRPARAASAPDQTQPDQTQPVQAAEQHVS
jgi:sec-independent protein translocase protein TatA